MARAVCSSEPLSGAAPFLELELGLRQTKMAQKPVLRAEVYARALRASQNVERAEVCVDARCAWRVFPLNMPGGLRVCVSHFGNFTRPFSGYKSSRLV